MAKCTSPQFSQGTYQIWETIKFTQMLRIQTFSKDVFIFFLPKISDYRGQKK